MPTKRKYLIGGSTVTFENRFDVALDEIHEILIAGLEDFARKVVTDARYEGNYTDRTGNLRRMITPNPQHASDVPTTYPSTKVQVTDADGQTRAKDKFTPPSDFDKAIVEERDGGYWVTIAAIMPYAAALEAKGYTVLSKAFNALIANPKSYFGESMTGSRIVSLKLLQQALRRILEEDRNNG